jgi:hypothetical protein
MSNSVYHVGLSPTPAHHGLNGNHRKGRVTARPELRPLLSAHWPSCLKNSSADLAPSNLQVHIYWIYHLEARASQVQKFQG